MPLPASPCAVIADDERILRDQLRARLAEAWPELTIVAEARNGLEAVEFVREHRPEVVFLDIRMPGLSGVDAARDIALLEIDDDEWLPEIVFVTAYDQYAVAAFEQGAVDYVLKPAELPRLRTTVARVKARLAQRSSDAPEGELPTPKLQEILHTLARQLGGGAPSSLEWVQASVGTTVQLIPIGDVLFFQSDEKYTRVQTASMEALIRKPIKELAGELDPKLFWQIHRSTLVNVRAISSVTRDERGRQLVSVRGHAAQLEVSRSYAGLFKGM